VKCNEISPFTIPCPLRKKEALECPFYRSNNLEILIRRRVQIQILLAWWNIIILYYIILCMENMRRSKFTQRPYAREAHRRWACMPLSQYHHHDVISFFLWITTDFSSGRKVGGCPHKRFEGRLFPPLGDFSSVSKLKEMVGKKINAKL
jgi:hypothetical protein